jgi:hypothetical protein
MRESIPRPDSAMHQRRNQTMIVDADGGSQQVLHVTHTRMFER